MQDFCGKIYKIEFPNGKHYIGCSTNLDERKKAHLRQAKLKQPLYIVHRAIKKFNMIDTFELIVIDNSAKSKEEMFEKEIFYIQQYNSHIKNNKGYNMTEGGEGNHGYVYTEADRKKMSQIQKKRCENPEVRAKLREQSIQYYSIPEAREKSSQIIKAYYENNPEAGKEHSQKLKAYFENNPEAREKARERATKQFSDPEQRKKMSQIKKDFFENNPEARKKLSQIKKEFFENNPEARKLEKNRKLFKVFRKKNMEFIKQFEYQFEAIEYIQKAFDINVNVLSSKISDVLNKKRNSTQGFVFEYVE